MIRQNRPTIVAAAIGLFVGWAGLDASAQSIDEEEREEAVDEETQEGAESRIGEQSDRLDREETEADIEKGPGLTQDDVETEGRSPQEIAELKENLEQKNRRMIQKLDRLIRNDPHNESKPDWMFQKAELMWELRNMEYLRKRSEYMKCMEAARQGTTPESKCNEPKPKYGDAQSIYKKILQQYPDYERLDEVIFRLGQGLMEAGKAGQGVSYLQRLVNNYPDSRYIPNANLSLAEHFFKDGVLGAAENKYERVLDFEDDPNYDYALYKLGWVQYNQGRYRDTIQTFKKVVERTDNELGFQDQAINDLVVAYAEVENGWTEMRDYFLEVRDREFTYDKLADLASLYEGQGKNRSAIQVYQYFIDQRGDHKRAPVWMESIVQARKKIGEFPETEKSINKYVSYLSRNGTWWKKNEGNEGARETARKFKQASLAFLANKYHNRAQDEEETKFYTKAADYYEEYIDRFPDDPASFDMNFFLGDIYLLKLDEYETAATFYQKVVDLYKDDNVPKEAEEKEIRSMVKDAAYGVVNCYNELVKEHHPDSILVRMAEYAEKNPGETYQAKDKEKGPPSEKDPNEKVELLKWEEKFVKASDQYSEMFPDTDITPTVDFVAAEVYKARGHYAECIDRYENIIENASEHRYASFAGNSLLEANYVLENWAEVEKWARHLLENKIFDITPKESLHQAIAFAINEKAKELKDGGETQKAANELLRLAKEFPDSKLAPGAIFNAAAIYESGDEVKKAVAQYKRVLNDYPRDEKAPEALFVLGAIAESRANFGKAASYFSRLGSDETYVIQKESEDGESDETEKKYYQHPKAADAVFNAAQLRKAMEKWSEAIATFEKYMETFPERDDIREVKLDLAYLEKKRDRPEKALERFQSFAERDDLEPEEVVEISTQIGLLMEETEPDEWKKKSDERFTEAYETWKNKLEGDKKKSTRNYAAHARFRQAERLYDKFKEVKLEFPQSKLEERLKKKGKRLSEAEKVYFEINETKSPTWASAASYRIGQMYNEFYQGIYDLPLPDGLNEQQQMRYRMFLDKKAAPIQEKAVEAFRSAWQLALQLRAYNEWSQKSAKKISDLESESFPVEEQRGVTTGHGQIRFYTPEPVGDFEVALDRQEKRYEKLKKEREKRRRERQEQKEREGGESPDGDSVEESAPKASTGSGQ